MNNIRTKDSIDVDFFSKPIFNFKNKSNLSKKQYHRSIIVNQ
jgi:hypothetical protein